MSYSHRGSHYYCHLTKQRFPFQKTRDGADQRRALAEMLSAQERIKAATNQRAMRELGRPASPTELVSGFAPPDTRTVAERVAEDAVHIGQPKHNPDKNPYSKAIADLRAVRPLLPTERAGHERRIESLKQKARDWDTRRAAEREREAIQNSPDVQAARSDAQALITLLSVRADVPQQWLNEARERLAFLEQTGNTGAYWAGVEAFEAEREQHRAAKLAELEEQKQAVAEAIDDVQSDRPPSDSE